MQAEYHNNLEQGSEEWLSIRLGRVGGSESAALLTDPRNKADREAGKLSSACLSLAYQKAGEKLVGQELPNFENFAMQRGSLLESEAREVYELETSSHVAQVGYITYGEHFGVSPDGLVGTDGAIEIKCPLAAEWLRYHKERTPKKEHYAQMQWLMLITGRQWCDYVVYHPDLGILIDICEISEATQSKLKDRMRKYAELMKEILV